MRWNHLLPAVVLSATACAGGSPTQPGPDPSITPPFSGTIFIDPDIILPSDPTSFTSIAYVGRGDRTMFDRRINGWVTLNAFLFDAVYDNGAIIEVQVNPEFVTEGASQVEADHYAEVIGRLPVALRADVETVWIHRGVEPFGGGNNNLLIHTGQGEIYERDGILEETFVHEAAHTSLDAAHRVASGWVAAQDADPTFISTYARDFPQREDIAESMVPYIAVRYRQDRVSAALRARIESTIPHRLAYLDGLLMDMHPIS